MKAKLKEPKQIARFTEQILREGCSHHLVIKVKIELPPYSY